MEIFPFVEIGHQYDRDQLAALWGLSSRHGISRGVFTPAGKNIIIFFITNKKQKSATQYEDKIEQDILFWEGEQKHGSDSRIVSRRDIIHVFYRDLHRSTFTYEGRAHLKSYQLNTHRPSKFSFLLLDKIVSTQAIVEDIKATYGLGETERDALIKSRRGQGLYRERALQLWKACSVTDFSKEEILIASHIKPWKYASNEERIDHFNSLILVPNLDKLFDKGYIGFESKGKILISDKISAIDRQRIGITKDLRLRQVPDQTRRYLEYHAEHKFDMLQNR